MKRDSFIFYASFWDAISDLEGNQKLQILEAVINYGLYGTEPRLEGVPNSLWKLIRPQLEANNRRYLNGCKGKDYGHLGGRKHPQANPTGVSNSNPKLTPNDNVNVNVKDNEKVNKGGYCNDFELLWAEYPNRPTDGKSAAYKKWKLAAKKFSPVEIHQSCLAYAATVSDKQYIKALTTLLSGDKFQDFSTAQKSNGLGLSLNQVLAKVIHPDDRFKATALFRKGVNEDAFRKITGYGFSQVVDDTREKPDGGVPVLQSHT